jgi:murein L,D-transpeptidase YcbB/YkuD
MAFQTRHGLVPDGVLGPGTRAELNAPAEQRLAQIDANLERWRWLPPLPADRVEVNIAGAEATLYRRGAAQLSMRVIVGDPRHRSPMFASRIDSIVFNPPWNVPASIAVKELLPKEAAHPGYFARNDFHFVDGALQQSPGPKNALGRLKFDFNSPFGVYLHDTPGRAAFGRPNRALSHGCIRLEKPLELAAAILPAAVWAPESIDAAIAAGTTLRVAVAQPIPLYVLYWSVVVAPDGQLLFHRDVYGWDAKLTQALAARRLAAEVDALRPATECAASEAPQPVL